MDTDEQFFPSDRALLRERLPWLHLFRAFRIAFRGRPILLAIVAVLLLDAGQQVIARLPFGVAAGRPEWAHSLDETGRRAIAVDLEAFSSRPVAGLLEAATHGDEVIRPLWSIVGPAQVLFQREHSWAQVGAAWTEVLWALIVWGVMGVAIARIAAVRFATDSAPSLRDSLRFSCSKLVSSLAAPLLPLLGVLVLWLMCLAGGALGRIPAIGPVLIGVAYGIPLLLAGLMTMILLVVAAGWPLMLSSIATEDADGFDAFSRVFSYVFARPWYALWLAIVALVYGSVLMTFLATAVEMLVPLSEWAVASGMGNERFDTLLTGGGESAAVATSAVQIWRSFVGLVLVGVVTSYFWTAATIIYFLLRRSVDATALTSVSLPIAEPTPQSLEAMPLVGVAAAERRESAATAEETSNSNL